MWWIYALLSAIFAGATTLLAKIGIRGVDSNLATAIRTVVIVIIAWSIVFYTKTNNGVTGLTKQNWIFLILSGVATGLSWIFYFKALQLGKVAQVAAVDKASLAFAVVLAILFLGEQLTVKTAIGVLLVIAGTVVLIK